MIPAAVCPFETSSPGPGYISFHFRITRKDYDANVSAGRRFYAIGGEELSSPDEVKAAMRKDGEVISR